MADLERINDVAVIRIADAGLVPMANIAVPRNGYRLWRRSDVGHRLTKHRGEGLTGRDGEVVAAFNASAEFRDHKQRLASSDHLKLDAFTGS